MQTNNVIVAVIGLDQPGVVACVSSVMTRLNCNIEHMTQTALHNQFAGIYVVAGTNPRTFPTMLCKRPSKKRPQRRR